MSHGAWCGSRTFPTNCPTCRAKVYYFSCDCGSRVFFDDLGGSWPRHDCDTSWANSLVRTIDSTGRIAVRLSPNVTATRSGDFSGIDESLAARARAKRERPDPIVRIDFTPSALEMPSSIPKKGSKKHVLGVLRELQRKANPLKAFRLPDTVMARQFLGVLGQQPVGKITVHMQSETSDQQESFTAWVPANWIEDQRIVRGIAVCAELVGVHVNRETAWFCCGFAVAG